MRLFATDYGVIYRVTRPFRLPHHSGSLLRGVLGRALRLSGCATPEKPCARECLDPARCIYARLFDPPVRQPLPHAFLRGSTSAPQPLIPLFPPPGKMDLQKDDTLEFGLRILGRLQDADSERFIAAVKGFAAFPLGTEGGRVEFSQICQQGRRNRAILVTAGDPFEGRLAVALETPVWLSQKGGGLGPDELDFPVLFRHAFRRLTMLCALYGETSPEDDSLFRDLDRLASDVQTTERRLRALQWKRHTLEKHERHPMHGLVGSILCEGPVGAFLPVLHAAELTLIGKATSHGLGRIRVETLAR